MEQREKDFVAGLLGLKDQAKEFSDLENQKRSTVETVMSVLTPDRKEELRQLFSERKSVDGDDKRKGKIRLVDSTGKEHEKMVSSRGQEHAIDTFGATRNKRGLSKEDMKQVGLAMKEIVEMTRMAIDKKGEDGKPLFQSVDELEREIFTPLVREGILPENFVLDQYSEVQKLLKEAFKSYQETNVESREEDLEKSAKSAANRYGAGTGLDRFKDTLKHLASAPKRLADKVGFDEDKRKWAGFLVNSGMTIKDIVSCGFKVDKWAQVDSETGKSKIVERYDKWLDPPAGESGLSDDDLRVLQDQERREAKITKYCKFLGLPETDKNNIVTMLNVQDEDGYFYTMESLDILFKQLILQGIDFAQKGKALHDIRSALKDSHHDSQKLIAAQHAAREIDKLLVSHLDKYVRKGVGTSCADAFYGSLDMEGLSDSVARTEPDHAEVLGIFASGFPLALNDGLDPALLEVGGQIAEAFVKTANGKALVKALSEDPKKAFAPVISAADKAISDALSKLDPKLVEAADKSVLQGAAKALASAIDRGISRAISKQDPLSGEAFSGLLEPHVDISTLVETAAAKKPKTKEFVDSIRYSIEEAFIFAAPDPTDETFRKAGQNVASEVDKEIDQKQLEADLGTDLTKAFQPVVAAILKGAEKAISGDKNFVSLLKNKSTAQALCAKAVFPDGGAEMMEELEKADEELAEYERQLVLIDEGGIAAADLQSIEKLIEQMKRDEQAIEMTLMVGNALTGFASTGVGLANWALDEFKDNVAGLVLGPLKAAKLILKLSVNLKKAADRIRLFKTFLADNERAKKAVSSLSSTLTGFVERKETQIAFRTIEDALLLVQIASTIVGSVPEPFTMAVGKTMGLINSAAQGVAEATEFLYTEAKLAEAWKTTIAALNNPKDRALGLAALRLNPTLAMHAIAWAAMKKEPADPIARMTLNDLGLNEQTLAVSGSERKVREYLSVKLSEDGEMIDPDLVAPDWAPKSVKLTGEDWYIVSLRAAREAVPKLARSTEREVLNALKLVEKHPIDQWVKEAESGKGEPTVLEKALAEAIELRRLLRNYAPVTSDGTTHTEMDNIGVMFSNLANEHANRLQEVVDRNRRQRAKDVSLTQKDLMYHLKVLGECRNDDKLSRIEKAIADARVVVLLVQSTRLDQDKNIVDHYKNLVNEIKALDQDLEAMQEWERFYPSFKSDILASWGSAEKEAKITSPDLTKALKLCLKTLEARLEDPKKTVDVDNAFGDLEKAIVKTLAENKGIAGLRLYLSRLRKAAKEAQR